MSCLTQQAFSAGLQLARVEREQIASLEKKIAQDLTQDMLKKRAVYAALFAGAGYLTYKYFNPSDVQALPATADQILTNNALLQANQELLLKSLPTMDPSSSWIKDSPLGKVGSFVWEFGKWSTQQAVIAYMANVIFMGTSSALGKAMKTIDSAVDSVSFHLFHERDLKWFLISRARVRNLFDELEVHAYCLETGTVHSERDMLEQEQSTNAAVTQTGSLHLESVALEPLSYVHHTQAFEQTWQQLSERIASLIAFIEYKAHTTEHKNSKERLLLGATYLLQLTNATAIQCEQLLADVSIDTLPSGLMPIISRLRASVFEELILANKIEHEVSW